MSSYPLAPSYLAQARNLLKVLDRISPCTPNDSLERAELVERLTKLLEQFEHSPGSSQPFGPAEGKAPASEQTFPGRPLAACATLTSDFERGSQ